MNKKYQGENRGTKSDELKAVLLGLAVIVFVLLLNFFGIGVAVITITLLFIFYKNW